MKKKKLIGKPLSAQVKKKEQERMSQLVGFLLGPYMLSEMHGRPPKIPAGYPSPEQIQRMSIKQMHQLKLVLRQFMQQTGGPDLTEEEKKNFEQLVSLKLNPTIKVTVPGSSPPPT